MYSNYVFVCYFYNNNLNLFFFQKFLEPIKEKPTLKKIATKKTINQLTKEATASMEKRNPKVIYKLLAII